MATVRFYYDIEIEDDKVLEYNDWKEGHLIEDEDYLEVAERIMDNRIVDECICAENFNHQITR